MQKVRLLLFLISAVGSYTVLSGLDFRDVEISINTALPDYTPLKPAHALKLGTLRKAGIAVFEVSIRNNSQSSIIVGADVCGPIPLPAKEKLASILWGSTRRVNLALSSIGVLGVLGVSGYALFSSCLQGAQWSAIRANKKLQTGFGISFVTMTIGPIFTAIENYLWDQVIKTFLYDMISIEPGQSITKFICFNASDEPNTIICRVRDMHNNLHYIPVRGK